MIRSFLDCIVVLSKIVENFAFKVYNGMISAGMNSHIGKPIDFNEVLAMLRKHLR